MLLNSAITCSCQSKPFLYFCNLEFDYKFEKEATTEFQDWAVDDPHDNFKQVFEEWMEGNKDPKNLEEMDDFVKRNFPKWYKDILKNEK